MLQQRGVLRRCRAQARHLLRPGLQCQHRVSWAAFAVPRGLHARAHHAARAALFACGRRLLPRQASHFLDVTGARVFWSCQTCVCAAGAVCARRFYEEFALSAPQNAQNFLASRGGTVTDLELGCVDTSKMPKQRNRRAATYLRNRLGSKKRPDLYVVRLTPDCRCTCSETLSETSVRVSYGTNR